MRFTNSAASLAFLAGLSTIAGPASASLIGATFNADITLSGSDDNGAYTVTVLNGPVTVSGPGDLVINTAVFKQLTEGEFSTANNQIKGTVTLDIGANTITTEITGQVQPFVLEGNFTSLPGTILTDVHTTSNIVTGVEFDLGSTSTANSVDQQIFFLGFQTIPGEGQPSPVSQTDTLTFGPVVVQTTVPEPGSIVVLCGSLLGLGLLRRRREVS